jgi:hypothetical protein
MPSRAVFGEPTSSSTISTSCSKVSIAGGSSKRSESPDPRRSIRISLEEPARRSRNADIDGYIQANSMLER